MSGKVSDVADAAGLGTMSTQCAGCWGSGLSKTKSVLKSLSASGLSPNLWGQTARQIQSPFPVVNPRKGDVTCCP